MHMIIFIADAIQSPSVAYVMTITNRIKAVITDVLNAGLSFDIKEGISASPKKKVPKDITMSCQTITYLAWRL